jgi:hypothetical protein
MTRKIYKQSIGVLGLGERQRSLEQDVEIETERPMIDIIEIVQNPLLDFFRRVRLAAPAIDLRPAGDAGPHPVAGKETIDDLLMEASCVACGRGPTDES